MRFRLPLICLAIVVTILAILPAVSVADDSHDRTQFGHDITVGSGEQVSDVTCFGCSVRIRGHVDSDVTVFGGSVIVEDQGEIGGDTTTFGGGVRLRDESKIDGDVTVFGGRLQRDPSATIGGDVTNFSSPLWLVLIVALPLTIFGALIAFVIWIVRLVVRPAEAVA